MTYLRTACLVLSALALPTAASAQLVVIGQGQAAECYQYAMSGNDGSRVALETCDGAFAEALSRNDRAATHVNRGVMLMRKGDQTAATKDYQKAIALIPTLTEAYVNLGASLIQQNELEAALTALNTALEDQESPTRAAALYNRAIVYDFQDNPKSAYYDLKAAKAIRPDWAAVDDLLSRYTVVRKSAS